MRPVHLGAFQKKLAWVGGMVKVYCVARRNEAKYVTIFKIRTSESE
jgi:hypothetical protein